MSKQFIVNRHTTPSTPTLDEVPNEKIRVFANETAIDAALSSLDEDEIVATEDGAESSTRIGNPLGTILAIHSNAVPYGYLPCNGVAFDEHQYPALYALLGDNHTPYSYDKSRLGDYEDFTLTTTNQEMPFDGVMVCEANIASSTFIYVNDVIITRGQYLGSQIGSSMTIAFRKGDKIRYVNSQPYACKVAYYTHFNVIKATSGLEETQQDYVLQSLLEADNYSTDEVATGKKWIDGKTIYRKVLDIGAISTGGSKNIAHNVANFSEYTHIEGIAKANDLYMTLPFTAVAAATYNVQIQMSATDVRVYCAPGSFISSGFIVIEYTKTN